MNTRPLLKTAMTPFPYAVDLRDTVSEARDLMASHGVHHLPVTREHDLVGVLSDRDLRGVPTDFAGEPPAPVRVEDVYTADPYVVDLEEPLDRVLMTMAERHIGCALVTRKGNLAGVFTNTDACRCFAEHLRTLFPEPEDDAAA
jgi:acetoin utilization protein AcuB